MVRNIFCFHPYLGKIPILTNIFQMGWNHQLEGHEISDFEGKVQLEDWWKNKVGLQPEPSYKWSYLGPSSKWPKKTMGNWGYNPL